MSGFLASAPLALRPHQIFLRDHFQNGADVLGHAAVDEHQALLKLLARFRPHLLGAENLMIRQQASAADAEFRIALLGRNPVNKLNARPYPSGILPAAARASQPFAQNGARGHQAAVAFGQAAGERSDLIGRAHAHGNEAGEKAGGHCKARAAGNIVHLADDFDAVARLAGEMGQDVGERLRGPLHPRRHDAGSDHRGLEQPQIVVGKVEHFRNRAEVSAALQVDTRQAQHRLIDDTKPGFHGRLGSARVAHAQVDGNVEHTRAFGEIHSQEEDVAPAAMAQVHTYRSSLSQDRKEMVGGLALQKFGVNAQGCVLGMGSAKHPLVAPNGAHAAAHLVGKSLKTERPIACRERAREGGARSRSGLGGEENVQSFLEPSLQQIGVAGKRNQRKRSPALPSGDVKAMNGIEKKQRPHALVKIVAAAAEMVECRAFFQQGFKRRGPAQRVQRAIASLRIARGNDISQFAHVLPPFALVTPAKAALLAAPIPAFEPLLRRFSRLKENLLSLISERSFGSSRRTADRPATKKSQPYHHPLVEAQAELFGSRVAHPYVKVPV